MEVAERTVSAIVHETAAEGLEALNRIRDGYVYVRCDGCGTVALMQRAEDGEGVIPCNRCGSDTATYSVTCDTDGCELPTYAGVNGAAICKPEYRALKRAAQAANQRPGTRGLHGKRRKKRR